MTIKHLRSSTLDKRPQASGMAEGQLAINTASGSPGLFFKDSAGSLVKVGPVHVGSGAPNASPASGGTTGNSLGEQWLDTTGGTYVFKIWDGAAWRSEAGEFVNVTGDTMTGALGIVTGSASTPGLFFSGDSNTGFYSPGADQVAISTNGTGRLFVNSAGVVTVQNGAVAVIGTLTDGATITPDFAANCNFTITLGGSRTLANPTNITAGQSGSIFIVQDATGSRTLSWGSYWDFPGGTAPTLTTAANAIDRVDFVVRSSTSIHAVFTANYS